AFIRWTHRLRVYYYHNEPGSPPALLARSFFGFLRAPFRAQARTEVRLYVELGAAFTVGFLLLDVVPEVVVPLLSSGRSFVLGAFLETWFAQALTTFLLIYMLAAPVGGVLTAYLLIRPTHTLPRILAGYTLAAVLLGTLAGAGIL
ncbi:MAG: TM2 domain-containing protein, partial [Gemmatimonadota bacterium]